MGWGLKNSIVGQPRPCACGCGRIVQPDPQAPTLKYATQACKKLAERRRQQQKKQRRAARKLLDKHGLPKAQPMKMRPVVASNDDDDDDVLLTMTGGL